MPWDETHAFWTLVVLLVYSAHPLELWTDVVAAADQLDRVAQLHLPVRVHEPLLLQLLAPAGLCGLELGALARVRVVLRPWGLHI